MLALQNFFRLGVLWVGPGADALGSRRVKMVMHHLALKVDHAHPRAPIRLTPEALSDGLYKRRSSLYALAALVKAGIITRSRSRTKKGLLEDVATTGIHPDLIAAAVLWNKDRAALRRLGKRGKDANPPPKKITLPLVQKSTSKNPLEIPPNCLQGSGNPHEHWAEDVPECKKCTPLRAKNAQTGCSTPPLAVVAIGRGSSVPQDIQDVQPQPAHAGARGGVDSPGKKTISRGKIKTAQLQQATRAAFLSATFAYRQEKARGRKKIDLGAS